MDMEDLLHGENAYETQRLDSSATWLRLDTCMLDRWDVEKAAKERLHQVTFIIISPAWNWKLHD